jgi:hypothetical protein
MRLDHSFIYLFIFTSDNNCATQFRYLCERANYTNADTNVHSEEVLPLTFNNGNANPCPDGYASFGSS